MGHITCKECVDSQPKEFDDKQCEECEYGKYISKLKKDIKEKEETAK
jgi:hypothetical protein